MRTAYVIAALAAGLATGSPRVARSQDEKSGAPLVERYLIEGNLDDGEAALMAAIEADPGDSQARFGLGVLQFLDAAEDLVQSLHGLGMRSASLGQAVPFLRLPVPPNPDSEVASLEDVRAAFDRFITDLAEAEATLSTIEDPDVKLPLHFGRFRLDLDGDGEATDEELLWRIYATLNRRADSEPSEAELADFVVAFDRGDVAWLRGYCHLLMALSETILAHDGREVFEHAGHLMFRRVESPYPFLQGGRKVFDMGTEDGEGIDIADAIAAIHVMRLPVSEPERMKAALGHLEQVIAQSRESWKFILAETDDDREWVPNPGQGTVMPGGRVTKEMVDGWMTFLDEAEALLEGRKLVPFWRGSKPVGVNLRRVFTEPTTFDLVLWVQGTAAVPYLEEGEMSGPETWGRLQRVFGGEFFGFALWIN